MGISADLRLYSDDSVGRTNRECVWPTGLPEAMAQYQRAVRLENEQLFYNGMSYAVSEEAQWDFILYLAGHPVEMACRFQIDPTLLETLRELYKRITSDG